MRGLLRAGRVVPTLWQAIWARLGLGYMAYRARGPLLRFVIHASAVFAELHWFAHIFRFRVTHQFLVLEALVAVVVGGMLAGIEPLKASLRLHPTPQAAQRDARWRGLRRWTRWGAAAWLACSVVAVVGSLAGGPPLGAERLGQWAIVTAGLLEVVMAMEALPIAAQARLRGSLAYALALELATRAIVVTTFASVGVWAFAMGAVLATAIRATRTWWIVRDHWHMGGQRHPVANTMAPGHGQVVQAGHARPARATWSWLAAVGGAMVRAEYLVIVLGYYLARRTLRFDLMAVLFATAPILALAQATAQSYAIDAWRAWRRGSWLVWRRYLRHAWLAALVGVGMMALIGIAMATVLPMRRGVPLGPTVAACAVAATISFGVHAMHAAWMARRYGWAVLGALAATCSAVATVATIGGGLKGQLVFGALGLLLNVAVWWRLLTLLRAQPGTLEFCAIHPGPELVQLTLARQTISAAAARTALLATPPVAHWLLPKGRLWLAAADVPRAKARLAGCLRSAVVARPPSLARAALMDSWRGGVSLSPDDARALASGAEQAARCQVAELPGEVQVLASSRQGLWVARRTPPMV